MKNKRKWICTVLLMITISCIVLSSCVSDTEFEALKKRVDSMESQLVKKNFIDVPAQEERTSRGAEIVDTTEEQGTAGDRERDTWYKRYYTYDMSADEIVAKCVELLDTIPSEGQDPDEYSKEHPLMQLSLGAISVYSVDEHDDECIYDPLVSGFKIGMDGKLTYNDDLYITSSVKIKIDEYDFAVEIYNKLIKVLSDYLVSADIDVTPYDNMEKKEEYTWFYNIGHLKGESLGTVHTLVVLSRQYNVYYLGCVKFFEK